MEHQGKHWNVTITDTRVKDYLMVKLTRVVGRRMKTKKTSN